MKDQILVLTEALLHKKKSLVLILVKQLLFIRYLFVDGKETYKFNASNKMLTFHLKFV